MPVRASARRTSFLQTTRRRHDYIDRAPRKRRRRSRTRPQREYHERVDDEEIRAALRRGDVEAAFRRFARAHGPAAYGPSLRIMGDRAAAEDVMQEALIAAFENRDKMLEITSLRGWLITIAIRKAYDALR